MASEPEPFRIFISYSHVDERFRESLDKHLSPLLLLGRVEAWHDRGIQAGARLYEKIQDKIDKAHIILMLISADYLASKSCQDEMAVALQKSQDGSAVAIPVVVRACNWTILPIGELLSANEDGRPINSQSDHDVAWTQVSKKIGDIFNDWQAQRSGDNLTESCVPESTVAQDELALGSGRDVAQRERWVNRRDDNDSDWEKLKSDLIGSFLSEAERAESSGVSVNVRPWGDKIIVDFRLPKYKNSRRLLIRDIGGYVGYPGYQLEVYFTTESLSDHGFRLRWLVNGDGVRVLRRTMPKGGDLSVHELAQAIWKLIAELAKVV